MLLLLLLLWKMQPEADESEEVPDISEFEDVVTNQPGRENEASSPTIVNPIPSESGATSSAPPPSYSEVVHEKSSQDLEKPNETTALNAGEKVGYTPDMTESTTPKHVSST